MNKSRREYLGCDELPQLRRRGSREGADWPKGRWVRGGAKEANENQVCQENKWPPKGKRETKKKKKK